MKTKIYIPDIECDSCTRLLAKKFKSLQGVDSFSFEKDSAELDYNEALIKPANIIQAVENSGFRASETPFGRKSLKERARDFRENSHKYRIEMTALNYAAYSFLILSLVEAIAYFGFFRAIPNFIGKYGWWLLYLNISISTLGTAVWHYVSYKARITCMTGMMIGMTFGMQAGMMIGAVIGATNGFFIGAMAGMLIGVSVGAATGKCCGIMGIMQGMMAGMMGGTMGPMISLMMFTDNLLLFMPFYMAINVMIVFGLSYMVYEEVVEDKKDVKKNPPDFLTFVSACLIVAFVLAAVMVLGPKSVLFIS